MGGEGNDAPLQYSCLENPMDGRLQSTGSWRVGHDWETSLSLFTFMHWRRKWQPTPVFLPEESRGRGSLVGCLLWGRIESDTTEATQQQQQSLWENVFGLLPIFPFEMIISYFLLLMKINSILHCENNNIILKPNASSLLTTDFLI